MKVLLMTYAILLSCSALSLEYQVEKNNELNTLSAINVDITLQQQLFEDNYIFSNHFTLHHSEHFNLSVTANVIQSSTFENKSLTDNKQIPSIYLPINNTSHQYGLIGRYSLTPEWKVSGGLIYSKPLLIMGNEQSNTDNVALIGTSYSF